MNVKQTLTLILAACLINGAVLAVERPNLVMIFIDDMGFADLSSFGNPAMQTPNMDRLAREGMRVTSFYVNSPICSPSRVALVTGCYPQRYRIHSFFNTRKSHRQRKMPDYLPAEAFTYAKLLQQNGYATAHFGKWHMGGGRDVGDAPLPQAYGYDESLVSFEGLGDRILWSKTGNQKLSWTHGRGEILDLPKHKTTETYVNRAIDFIERNKDRPFLVNVFPNDVHDPHLPSEEQEARWRDASGNPYEQKFFAVLDELDRQIGRVLDALDENGLTDNTIVMLTSDNGPTDWPRYYKEGVNPPGFTGPFFGRKWSLYEGGIRMPFLIRWPNHVPAGATNHTTVMSAIDMLPSLAGLTGVGVPAEVELDGLDVSAALLGKGLERRRPLFWEYGVYGSIKPGKEEHISPQLAMRDGDWKLLMNPDGSDLQLFNLKEDPSEQNNLAPAKPDRAEAMKQTLGDWWAELSRVYEGY
jgi:arylsulfatase A-like enzyme